MAKLQEYKNIEEKVKYFNNGDIKVVVNIEKMFEELDKANNGDFIFRGLSEAKYKLYNSAQRHYITNELYRQVPPKDMEAHYDNFIHSLIEECKAWNNETVKKLLKASAIDENNSLAYLSFMQHFGVPTPFIDFTFDPYKALFFAIDGLSYLPSDVEIDNYFSIYYTYHNATIFEGWKHAFKKIGNGVDNGQIGYEEVTKSSMNILLPSDEPYRILNNTNIINQQGLFFYNNHSSKPMEEGYLEFAARIKERFGQKKFDEMLMLETFANCFNIHKSLIPHIKQKLSDKGITREFMYPNMNQMKNKVLEEASMKAITLKK